MRSPPFSQLRTRHMIRVACVGLALLGPFMTSAVAGAAPFKAPAKATATKTTNPLPVLSVTDVKTGKAFPLATAFDGKRPLLVWFWAPT